MHLKVLKMMQEYHVNVKYCKRARANKAHASLPWGFLDLR
jgi:hypothetical protein